MDIMGSIVSTAVAVMAHSGDLSPAGRYMGSEALSQWATLHGVDAVDMAYVLGVTYARATVAPDDGDDNPLSGEWADDPTPQDVREVVATLYGLDAWDCDQSVDAFESGYYDERNGQWADAPTMADVLDTVTSAREA